MDIDMDLDIKINPYLLQIRLRSAHRYPNPIQIHFKSIQIQSNWIWITWILDQIQSIAIPTSETQVRNVGLLFWETRPPILWLFYDLSMNRILPNFSLSISQSMTLFLSSNLKKSNMFTFVDYLFIAFLRIRLSPRSTSVTSPSSRKWVLDYRSCG